MAIEDKITINIVEELRKEFQEKMKAEAKERGDKTFPVFIINIQSIAGRYALFLEDHYCKVFKMVVEKHNKEKKS